MKRILLLAVMFMAVAFVPQAKAQSRGDMTWNANRARSKVVKRHGAKAAGRDIVKFGVRFVAADHTRQVRRAKPSELRRYTAQLRQLVRPPPLPHLTRTAVPPSRSPAGTLTPSVKANLPYCTWGPESGGDYHASNGTHFGKYQFDLQTWQSVGGTGNPLNASPAEQDYRAAKLYAQRGGAPWVNC